MEMLANAIGLITGIVSLVCYILVIVKMFQHGQTVMGIVCLVLLLCCGLGGLIAFIFGWVKAKEWNITNIMIIWSICILVNIIAGVMNPAPFQQLQQMRG